MDTEELVASPGRGRGGGMSRLWQSAARLLSDDFFGATLVFCLIVLAYFPGKPMINDGRWSIPTAVSILTERNTDLDEFGNLLRQQHYVGTQAINGHYYSGSPAEVSLMVLPFAFVASRFIDFTTIDMQKISYVEHYVALVIAALAAVFMFLVVSRLVKRRLYAFALTLVFAFCTSMWSTASLSLFQHGQSVMMLTIALYLLVRAREKPSLAQYASIPLAYAFLIRPTNIIPLALLSLYVAWTHRAIFWRYVLWGLPLLGLMAAYNYVIYGSPLSAYYSSSSGLLSTATLPQGLAGTLVSPARGLLVYSPVLVFAFAGVWLKARRKEWIRLDYFIVATVVLHWLLISSYEQWWAGESYGPRYFTDMMPFFVYFLVPAINRLGEIRWRARVILAPAILMTVAVSLFAHYQGTASEPARSWNVHPQIFDHRDRLWDWSQIPFLTTDFKDRP